MGKSCVRISVSVPRTTTKITALATNNHKQDLAALVVEIRGEVILSPPGFHLEARRRGVIYQPPPPALTVVTIELTLAVVLCPPE